MSESVSLCHGINPQFAARLDRFAAHKADLLGCLRRAAPAGRAFDAELAWGQLVRVAALYLATPSGPRGRSPDAVVAEARQRLAPFAARFDALTRRSIFRPASRHDIADLLRHTMREVQAVGEWSKKRPVGRQPLPSITTEICMLATIYQQHTGERPAGPTFDAYAEENKLDADRRFPALCGVFLRAVGSRGTGAENIKQLIRAAKSAPLWPATERRPTRQPRSRRAATGSRSRGFPAPR